MPMPNAQAAVVAPEKLIGYILNPQHFRGKHKARVFASALGFDLGNHPLFLAPLLEGARSGSAEIAQTTEHGTIYRVDFNASGPAGQAGVRSLWLIRTAGGIPEFITCYVL